MLLCFTLRCIFFKESIQAKSLIKLNVFDENTYINEVWIEDLLTLILNFFQLNMLVLLFFSRLNDVVIPAINSTSPKVRAESLWLVGSAAQSNPKVQIAVLNAGIMQKLVKAAVLDSDETVQARAIYALSCLTRQFPAAQSKLVNEGGLSTLKTILDSERFSDLKTKVILTVQSASNTYRLVR